ncbi:MAG: zf-HC2 domain-containing protein [Deltaproteobacteria bacterium]|nr:MAG: zf-HC2 domain-containing protein [Deltaproteobacteria bacterium]TMB27477.1 MAG: zf-HC2 domain-containing protein [Deltaproteobacteria bacterium]
MTRRVPEELTCAEMVRLVTDFLEDALSLEDRTHFEQHLVFCKGCAAYVRQMRKTIEASSALKGEGLSAEAQAELLRLFKGTCK